MEIIDIIAEVLKYVLPAAIVLLAVKYMNDSRLEQERLDRNSDVRKEILRTHLPLKLSAYERAVLYLERIHPGNLLARVGSNGKSAQQLHLDLIREIRQEYEHNLAQQIYISPVGWAALVKAKEEVLAIINQSGREQEEGADAMALGKSILEKFSSMSNMPTLIAINVLKGDIERLFKV